MYTEMKTTVLEVDAGEEGTERRKGFNDQLLKKDHEGSTSCFFQDLKVSKVSGARTFAEAECCYIFLQV